MKTAAPLFLLLFACTAEDPAVPDWETYRDQATRVFEGETSYVIDGDQPATLDDLRRNYLAHVERTALATAGIAVEESHSIVNLNSNGNDDIWGPINRWNLKYCVSDEFGSKKQRMVAEMQAATEAWEKWAGVNFVYLPAHDANCSNKNKIVVFSVRPWNQGGACAFFPSGPGCVMQTLVINIPSFDNSGGPVTTKGVLIHELGHILGLRHEHIRISGTGCDPENDQWRELTNYDSGSVMHYPWCDGSNVGELKLTRYDISGISQLYP